MFKFKKQTIFFPLLCLPFLFSSCAPKRYNNYINKGLWQSAALKKVVVFPIIDLKHKIQRDNLKSYFLNEELSTSKKLAELRPGIEFISIGMLFKNKVSSPNLLKDKLVVLLSSFNTSTKDSLWYHRNHEKLSEWNKNAVLELSNTLKFDAIAVPYYYIAPIKYTRRRGPIIFPRFGMKNWNQEDNSHNLGYNTTGNTQSKSTSNFSHAPYYESGRVIGFHVSYGMCLFTNSGEKLAENRMEIKMPYIENKLFEKFMRLHPGKKGIEKLSAVNFSNLLMEISRFVPKLFPDSEGLPYSASRTGTDFEYPAPFILPLEEETIIYFQTREYVERKFEILHAENSQKLVELTGKIAHKQMGESYRYFRFVTWDGSLTDGKTAQPGLYGFRFYNDSYQSPIYQVCFKCL